MRRSLPTVTSWPSPGAYLICRKMVLANSALWRDPRRRFHTTQDPSTELLRALSPSTLMATLVMASLCSRKLCIMTGVGPLRLHRRTRPSLPPVTTDLASADRHSAVTESGCASLITCASFPDCGRKMRTRPSLHPLTMRLPSRVMSTQWTSTLGTVMRNSSVALAVFHSLISLPLAVSTRSELPLGKTASTTGPGCDVPVRVAVMDLIATS